MYRIRDVMSFLQNAEGWIAEEGKKKGPEREQQLSAVLLEFKNDLAAALNRERKSFLLDIQRRLHPNWQLGRLSELSFAGMREWLYSEGFSSSFQIIDMLELIYEGQHWVRTVYREQGKEKANELKNELLKRLNQIHKVLPGDFSEFWKNWEQASGIQLPPEATQLYIELRAWMKSKGFKSFPDLPNDLH